jgi:hypothetical protein
MPEVDSRFEQFLHGDGCQTASFVDCIPAMVKVAGIDSPIWEDLTT